MEHLGFYQKTERPWIGRRLTNAAIVGHTTETTSRIWVRAWEEGPRGDDSNIQPDVGAGSYWLAVADQPIDTAGQPRIREVDDEHRLILGNEVVATAALVPMTLTFDTDLTGVATVTGLEAGRRYYYALFAGFERTQRWEVGDTEPLSFRTLPHDPDRISFGLFSCHQPFKDGDIVRSEMWQGLYDALDAEAATHVIGSGDQVYVDGLPAANIWAWLAKVKDDPRLEDPAYRRHCMDSWYRDVYRGFWGHPTLRKVFSRFPTYMTWDDHEIMDGWGSLTAKERLRAKLTKNPGRRHAYYQGLIDAMFEAAQRIYFEYQHAHNPATAEGQWDYGFAGGPAATYVLDLRGHRDFEHGAAGQKILGPAQQARFAQWLESPQAIAAGVVFVVSSVPVMHHRGWVVNRFDKGGPKDDFRDQWEHSSNRRERRWLLDRVGAFSARHGIPVVFLSGDVHMSAAFRLEARRTPAARVYQLTTSGITYSGKARVPNIPLIGNRAGDYLVPRDGYVGGTGEQWSFERIQQVIERQNFAVLRVSGRPSRVTWNLYGSSDEAPNGVIRFSSLDLD